MHHKNIYILTLFQEALNILETAVRTFKNQSNEQRLPDAVHAEDIRMLENRKTKLKPDQVVITISSSLIPYVLPCRHLIPYVLSSLSHSGA